MNDRTSHNLPCENVIIRANHTRSTYECCTVDTSAADELQIIGRVNKKPQNRRRQVLKISWRVPTPQLAVAAASVTMWPSLRAGGFSAMVTASAASIATYSSLVPVSLCFGDKDKIAFDIRRRVIALYIDARHFAHRNINR